MYRWETKFTNRDLEKKVSGIGEIQAVFVDRAGTGDGIEPKALKIIQEARGRKIGSAARARSEVFWETNPWYIGKTMGKPRLAGAVCPALTLP